MIGTDGGWLADHIRDVPDFPKPGVLYKDITPLLADAKALEQCVTTIAEYFEGRSVDAVVGIEARGFILAAPVAVRLGAGFVPVRKPGKLPWETVADTYDLEYGSDTLEIHRDALWEGQRVAVVDDVLATGGTASAAIRLVRALGAEVIGFGCVIELGFLAGRQSLTGLDVMSLVSFP